MSLVELFKSHSGKISDKWSSYIQEYNRLLTPFRGSDIHLLEIGVQNGGSLEIWEAYFGSSSKIIGCDIDPSCRKLQFKSDRVHVVIGDAGTDSVKKEIVDIEKDFNVIIDDGSHESSDIITTFLRYFPHVVDGGIYIIEDLHCSYLDEYVGGLYHPYSSMAFLKKLADILNYEHWGIKIQREQLFEQFCREYNVTVDNNLLASIHSIEFVNSLCIINKQHPSKNTLGKRIISGDDETVTTAIQNGINHSQLITPPQNNNHWSTLPKAPEYYYTDLLEEKNALEKKLEYYRKEIAAIQESWSWKITAPLRFFRSIFFPEKS